MDSLYWKIRQSPWLPPVLWSFLLHLALVIAMMFIIIPSPGNPKEHVTQFFRVKGVQGIPVIAGAPGGGQSRRFLNSQKLAADPSAVQDVSLQSLVSPQEPLKKAAVDVQPKSTEVEAASVADTREFQALLAQTQESRLKDKIQTQQRSTRSAAASKAYPGKGRAPGQEVLVQNLQKALSKINLYPSSSIDMDPEEGMPGFTPVGSGGGGGGGTGSGSPGGFPEGLVGEPKQDLMRYGSLDNFLDIEILTYQDPADSQKYFMIKIFAKKDAKQLTIMPKEMLFTIDCSLSISPDRLDEFKRGIGACLKNLNKDDVFNVIAFQDKASFFSEKSVKATPETIKKAERFVSELTSNRTTDVYGAFEKIVRMPPERRPSNIILISDGRPTHGIVNSRELINSVTRLNDKKRPVFAFSGGAKVNRYLLDFISYQNRAWSQFIKDRGKIHKGLVDFYSKIKDPIFLNLRYELNNLNSEEVFPRSLPDFYRNAEFTLYGKYENENEFSMQLLGDVEGKTHELIFSRALRDAHKGGPDIMKGYAFNKIYYLISRLTAVGHDAALEAQIKELSKRYQVTTPYSAELETVD